MAVVSTVTIIECDFKKKSLKVGGFEPLGFDFFPSIERDKWESTDRERNSRYPELKRVDLREREREKFEIFPM